MRRSVFLIPAILCALVARAAEPPKPIPHDEQDLIFFHADRPYHLRLHLQIGRQSYQTQWNEILQFLFTHLDQDGNGLLTEKELSHAPYPVQLRQLILGTTEMEAMPPPDIKEITDTPATGVTLAQLKAYYLRHGVAPWQVEWAKRVGQDKFLDDELFRMLGKPKSDVLTRDDLKNAEKSLMRHDTDGDELITLPELAPNRGYPGFNLQPALDPDAPFFLYESSEKGRRIFAERMLKHYDQNKDGKLGPKEVAFDAKLLATLDTNNDGFLQSDELARWPDQPPDLELLVRLDGAPDEGVFLLPDAQGRPRALAKSVQHTRIGAAVVRLKDTQLEFLRVDATPGRMQAMRQMSVQQFRALDTNQDGVLDSKEIFQPPFAMVPILRLADRDGDDKLSEKEFVAFIELRQKLVTRTLALTLVDRGEMFFDMIDADRDRRLSQRELRTLAARLEPWLDAKTGTFGPGQVPRQFQILVSHGVLRSGDGDPGSGSVIRPDARLRGPLWFRKMDRNADGDVSRAEFLGTDGQFRKLDLDGDGLIDVHEAEAAEKNRK